MQVVLAFVGILVLDWRVEGGLVVSLVSVIIVPLVLASLVVATLSIVFWTKIPLFFTIAAVTTQRFLIIIILSIWPVEILLLAISRFRLRRLTLSIPVILGRQWLCKLGIMSSIIDNLRGIELF